jgi:hypothetical protein
MAKKNEQPSGPGYVISDGVSTPSNLKELEERFGLIPPGTSIEVWEKWQLAEWSQRPVFSDLQRD